MSARDVRRKALQTARASAARHSTDCGSSEVQAALLTQRITYMTAHLRSHPKDKHSRLGLIGMLNNRKSVLAFLFRKDKPAYVATVRLLGLNASIGVPAPRRSHS